MGWGGKSAAICATRDGRQVQGSQHAVIQTRNVMICCPRRRGLSSTLQHISSRWPAPLSAPPPASRRKILCLVVLVAGHREPAKRGRDSSPNIGKAGPHLPSSDNTPASPAHNTVLFHTTAAPSSSASGENSKCRPPAPTAALPTRGGEEFLPTTARLASRGPLTTTLPVRSAAARRSVPAARSSPSAMRYAPAAQSRMPP